MRWEDSVYVLNAEDYVRRAAERATRRCNDYVRANRELEGLPAKEGDRKASAQRLKQQHAVLRDEEGTPCACGFKS